MGLSPPAVEYTDEGRQKLEWNGLEFTLNGSPLTVKLRPDGIRVGCHFASYEAIAQLTNLANLKKYL